MKEFVHIPSGEWTLHGIVHVPAEAQGRRVGVVVVVGPNTKFGTHRLFLQLADVLAQAGFYVLRYDGRGTWDSEGICDLTISHRLADARAAVAFFRRQYGLGTVVGWGLCLGAVIALHHGARAGAPEERLDGLVLCNPLLRYSADVQGAARSIFVDGTPVRKLWKMLHNRENWTRKLPLLLQQHVLRRETELDQFGAAVRQVGELVTRYEGPMLMVFGELDRYWAVFRDEVNPGDRLGLAKKKLPPAWALVKNGDHTFSSREQTEEVLRYTLEWAKPFLHGPAPGPVHSPLAEQLWRYPAEAQTGLEVTCPATK